MLATVQQASHLAVTLVTKYQTICTTTELTTGSAQRSNLCGCRKILPRCLLLLFRILLYYRYLYYRSRIILSLFIH